MWPPVAPPGSPEGQGVSLLNCLIPQQYGSDDNTPSTKVSTLLLLFALEGNPEHLISQQI